MNENNQKLDMMTEMTPETIQSWIYLLLLSTGVHLVYTGVSYILSLLRPTQDVQETHDTQEEKRDGRGTFETLKDQCVAKQPVPVDPAPSHHRATSYGLDADEQSASILYGELDEDLTTRELRKLQKMKSFKEWCVKNKMDSAALQDVFSRVHLYKKLKEIHPSSFWALCSESSLISVDVEDPGVLVSLAEYLLSRLLDASVAYGIYWYASTPSPSGIAKAILSVHVSSLVIRRWMRGRSSGAGMFSAWYETSHLSEQYRTTSGMIRVSLASILEDIFVLGTLGIGALISIHGRCFSESKQSIGERIAGVRLIVEKMRRLDQQDTFK